jgi:hypothetical protein
VETGANPVPFRIGGTTSVGLHQCRFVEAGRKGPDKFQGGATLHVKQFQNHRTSLSQGCEASQSFGNQKTLNRIFLAIEVGAEVESAIGCVDIGFAIRQQAVCCGREGILVG